MGGYGSRDRDGWGHRPKTAAPQWAGPRRLPRGGRDSASACATGVGRSGVGGERRGREPARAGVSRPFLRLRAGGETRQHPFGGAQGMPRRVPGRPRQRSSSRTCLRPQLHLTLSGIRSCRLPAVRAAPGVAAGMRPSPRPSPAAAVKAGADLPLAARQARPSFPASLGMLV